MKTNKFKLPRAVIIDSALPLSARKVAAALYAYCNREGQIKKSYRELAKITGCAPKTVQQAVEHLKLRGYITQIKHTTRWDSDLQKAMTDTNIYMLNMDCTAGYALLPYRIFSFYRELTPAAFVVCLYIHLAAGAAHRAYPSISKISAVVGISRSTVCRVLVVIKSLPMLLVQLCRKSNGAMTCSSYYPVAVTSSHSASRASDSFAASVYVPVDMQPSVIRFRAAIYNSILSLALKVCNLFPAQGVVPNLLQKER